MKITIVGAGNMGLAITAYLAKYKENIKVILYTNKDILRYGKLDLAIQEENIQTSTSRFEVTSSIEKAFSNTDLVFCTYPAFLRKKFINSVGKTLKKGTFLGFIPGYGGAEYMCQELIQKGIIVFGLQRVPYVARYKDCGTNITATILSKKRKLFLASIPYQYSEKISNLISDILDIPTNPLNHYLAITLAPSNPLLHISGLYTIFKDYKPGSYYDKQLKFYEEWSDDTSDLLLKYDQELQNICRGMKPIDLHEVIPLVEYYESSTNKAMTRKLKSIKAFEEVLVPLMKVSKGYIPDFSSRMFTEDFPYGVCILKAYGLIANVNTPVIDSLLDFYYQLTGIQYFTKDYQFGKEIINTGIPQLFGLKTKEDIIKFYKQ